MKKIVFVVSHLYSGSTALCMAMDLHPRIQIGNLIQGRDYTHPMHLIELSEQPHKFPNRAAIYLEELLYNHQFCVRAAYGVCKFIYVVREPESVLNFMMGLGGVKNPEFASRAYLFRLRRMCEMAKRSGGVLLTFEDLMEGRVERVPEYLGLKVALPYDVTMLAGYQRKFSSTLCPYPMLTKAQDTYEKYLYFLKKHLQQRSSTIVA